MLEHDAAEPDAEETADLMADKGKADTSVANQRVPNISATSAEVGGTVESQVKPDRCAERRSPRTVVIGNEMKTDDRQRARR